MNLKIGVLVGGWFKLGDFLIVVVDLIKWVNFVKNVMKFVKYINMDFVDLDWEYFVLVWDVDFVDNKNDEGILNVKFVDK